MPSGVNLLPIVVADDTNGLICVHFPGNWARRDDLTQGGDVGPMIRRVGEILKHPCLVGEIRCLTELGKHFTTGETDWKIQSHYGNIQCGLFGMKQIHSVIAR